MFLVSILKHKSASNDPQFTTMIQQQLWSQHGCHRKTLESGASSLTLEGTNDYLLAALVPFTANI